MNPFKRIIDGVTDESVWKRAAWMYVSFFLLFEPVIVLSYFLLPEGFLRGKHPIISALEFSAYLLAAVTAYRFTLWYSDRKSIIRTRKWREVRLARSEKILLGFSFVLLLCAALVESYGIIQLSG